MQKYEFNGSITTFPCKTLLVYSNIHPNIIYYAEKNNLYIADLKTNKKEYIHTEHLNNINSLSLISKRDLLITTDVSGRLILTSTETLTELNTFKIGPGLTSLSVSKCGDFFLSFYKGKIKVFSIQNKTISLIFAYTNLVETITKSNFITPSNDNELVCLCQTKDNLLIAIEIVFTNFSKCYCSLVKHIITQKSKKINNFYGSNNNILILQNNIKLSVYNLIKEDNKTKIIKKEEIDLEEKVLNIEFYRLENDTINFITLNKNGKLKIFSLVNNTELNTVYELDYTEHKIDNLLSLNCNMDGSFIFIKYINNKNVYLNVFEWSTNNKLFNTISTINNKIAAFDIKDNYLVYSDYDGILYIYTYVNGEDGKLITTFVKLITPAISSKIDNIKWITNSLLICSNGEGDLMAINTNYETIKTIYQSEDKIIALNVENRTEDILIYFSELNNNKIVIYSYNSNDVLLELDAHKLPVTTLISCKEGLISSGYDGRIIKWNFLRQQEETRAFTSKNIIKSKITNQTFEIKDTIDMSVIFSSSIRFNGTKAEALFLGCITEESHFVLLDTLEFNMVLDYNFKNDLTPNLSKENLFVNTQCLIKRFSVLKLLIEENNIFKAFLAFVSDSNEICVYSLNLQMSNNRIIFVELIHIDNYNIKLNLEDYTKLKYHKKDNKTKKLKIDNKNIYNNNNKVVNMFNEFDDDNTLQNSNELIDIKIDNSNIFVSTSTEGIIIFNKRNYLSKSTLASNDNSKQKTKSEYEKELIFSINKIRKNTKKTNLANLLIIVLETKDINLFELYLNNIISLNLDIYYILNSLNFTMLIILLEYLKHYMKKECINIEMVNYVLKVIVIQRKEYIKDKRSIINENDVNYNKEKEFVECLQEVNVLYEKVTDELKEQTDKLICMMELYTT